MENFVPSAIFNDDREMPLLGLGTYKLRGEECIRVIREAIELGYRKFDTATLYDNEEAIGKALAQAFKAGDVTRDEVLITSKVWHDSHGAGKTAAAFERSLNALGLDYLDLYLIHWPWPQGGKFVETFEEMARLQGMGQIASIGVANFYEEPLEQLISAVGIVPVLNQVELHPYFMQSQLHAFHEGKGIVTEAWSSLARGELLTNPVVADVAQQVDATAAQVVLAYLLKQGISVIPKSASRERLEENMKAASIELSRDHCELLAALDKGGEGRLYNDPRNFPG